MVNLALAGSPPYSAPFSRGPLPSFAPSCYHAHYTEFKHTATRLLDFKQVLLLTTLTHGREQEASAPLWDLNRSFPAFQDLTMSTSARRRLMRDFKVRIPLPFIPLPLGYVLRQLEDYFVPQEYRNAVMAHLGLCSSPPPNSIRFLRCSFC